MKSLESFTYSLCRNFALQFIKNRKTQTDTWEGWGLSLG